MLVRLAHSGEGVAGADPGELPRMARAGRREIEDLLAGLLWASRPERGEDWGRTQTAVPLAHLDQVLGPTEAAQPR